MSSPTLDEVALRSTNPVKRAMDVLCIVVLQLLILITLDGIEPDPQKRRACPHGLPGSTLSRLIAGDTFDLPLLLIAPIRAFVDYIRTRYPLPQDQPSRDGESSAAPPLGAAVAVAARPASPATPRRQTPGYVSTAPRLRPAPWPPPMRFRTGPGRRQFSTPRMLRLRNEMGLPSNRRRG